MGSNAWPSNAEQGLAEQGEAKQSKAKHERRQSSLGQCRRGCVDITLYSPLFGQVSDYCTKSRGFSAVVARYLRRRSGSTHAASRYGLDRRMI